MLTTFCRISQSENEDRTGGTHRSDNTDKDASLDNELSPADVTSPCTPCFLVLFFLGSATALGPHLWGLTLGSPLWGLTSASWMPLS